MHRCVGPTCLSPPAERAVRGSVRRIANLASIAGVVVGLTAVSTQAQTLTDALAEAYNTNPQLLAQRALLRATDEQVPQALSFWRPQVTFTGQVGLNTSSLQTPPVSPSLNGLGQIVSSSDRRHIITRPDLVQFQAIEPVYRGGRTVAQTRQAINTVESTRAQTLAVETSVFQAVAMAYLDVVRDQALVEVDRNNVDVLRKQLEATQDRFRVGEVTRTDVAQAESSLAQANGHLVTAQGNLENSRAGYVRAVGHPPGTLMLPRERPALPATLEEAVSLAGNNNFNVLSANFTELAARDNINVVRGQLLPQISVIGTLTRGFEQTTSLKNTLTNSASVI